MRGYSNPPAEFGVCHLAIADGAFGRYQSAIFEGFEDSRFRGGDAGVFQDVVRPVGKAVVGIIFKIGTFLANCRGVNAGPLAKIPVSVDTVGGRVAMRVEFAGAQGGSDGLLLDGKAGFGQKMIEPFGQAVGGGIRFYGARHDKSARPDKRSGRTGRRFAGRSVFPGPASGAPAPRV